MFGIGNVFYLPARHPNRLVSTNVETSFFFSLCNSFLCREHLPRGFFLPAIQKKTSANAGFAWIMVGFERALSCLI